MPRQPETAAAEASQRLDKWLFFSRMVKSRPLAADLIRSGHVRVNGDKAHAAAKTIRPGDVLTIALDRQVRVLRVVAPGIRRGPYAEARLLYEDLAPSSVPDDSEP